MTEESLTRDKHYKLSWELGIGVILRPFKSRRDIELMAGIGYDQSPIPDETFSLDNPSLSQLAASIGTRFRVGAKWRFAVTYLLLAYLPREVKLSKTSPPTHVQGHGYAHLPGIEAEYTF
jgi:long-subunit fatty acid transport protein